MRPIKAVLLASVGLGLIAPGAAQAASPTVTTGSASAITTSAATVYADVTPHGLATTYAFQYGTSTAYGVQTSSHNAGSGTAAKAISVRITGLTPGVRYHYRVIASNADGTTVGSDRSFATALPPAKPPSVLATAPFAPAAAGVTFTALLNPDGATTTWRFQYGTSTAYGLETFGKLLGPVVTPRSVSFRINSLAPHTTYHFRVVASNRAGTTYGPDTLAQTGPFPPGQLVVAAGPHRQRRSHPWYVVKGHLVLGSGVSTGIGCGSGRVSVWLTSGRHTVGHTHKDLHAGHCSFRTRVHVTVGASVTRLRVHVRFGGNAILTPFDAPTFLVGIG